MPNIITAATIALLFRTLFTHPKGVVNDTLIMLGFIIDPINFELSATAARIIVAFIQFWMWYGYTMLIFSAGIMGLKQEIYESSSIDGATGIQQFFLITLPNLRTIVIYILVSSLINGLNMFDVPQLYATGGPTGATTTASLFIYGQAFGGSYLYNTAAAASMIMFIIIAVLAGFVFFILRDRNDAKIKRAERQAKNSAKNSAKNLGGV